MTERLTVADILDCPACMAHYLSPECAHLPAACASVGIEHGSSTRQMILQYLAAYHHDNHQEIAHG